MRRLLLGLVLSLIAFGAGAQNLNIQRVTSPGGIEAWLVIDRTIPVLSLEFAFRGGGALEPQGREGLASMVASLLTEGAGPRDQQQFAAALEDRVISLSFDSALENMTGSLRALTRDRELAAELVADALTRPRFEPAAIERVRSRAQVALRRNSQEPATIASLAWFSTAFPQHPYGRTRRGTAESLAAITRDDIVAFHGQRYARDNLLVAAVGDITPQDLGAFLDRAFGALPPTATAAIAVPPITPRAPGRTVVITRPQPQTYFLFGQIGIAREDPDYPAALVVNHILGGGGFGSRLMYEVRERRGLTYGIGSGLLNYESTDLLYGTFSSDNARAAEALTLVRAEWRRMREQGPTAAELADSIANLTGGFALRLNSTRSIARILIGLRIDRRPPDYIARRIAQIRAVTLDQARRVARRMFDPDALFVVAVGNPANLQGGGS